MKVVGHKRQKAFLEEALSSSKLAHGYLFTGDDGIGKRSLALEFFSKLHCVDGKNGACDVCPACTMVQSGVHPDLHLVGPNEKGSIGMEMIANLLKSISLQPSFSSIKTVLVDDAHLLNPHAQNSLLKTLEEPGERTLIVLVTHQPDRLLGTIHSRLQEVRFSPLNGDEMISLLKDVGEEIRDKIVQTCMGKAGRALEMTKDMSITEKEESLEEEVVRLAKSDLDERFKYVAELAKGAPVDVLEAWVRYLRRILLERIGSEEDLRRVPELLKELESTLYLLKTSNISKKMVLQNLMIKF